MYETLSTREYWARGGAGVRLVAERSESGLYRIFSETIFSSKAVRRDEKPISKDYLDRIEETVGKSVWNKVRDAVLKRVKKPSNSDPTLFSLSEVKRTFTGFENYSDPRCGSLWDHIYRAPALETDWRKLLGIGPSKEEKARLAHIPYECLERMLSDINFSGIDALTRLPQLPRVRKTRRKESQKELNL
jgi:hypothetical protein